MGAVNYFGMERMKKIMLNFLTDKPIVTSKLCDNIFIYVKTYDFGKIRYCAKEQLILFYYDTESNCSVRCIMTSETLLNCHNFVTLEESLIGSQRILTNTYNAWYDETFNPFSGNERLFCKNICKQNERK